MAQPWLSHLKSQAVTSATAGFISARLDRLAAFKPSRGNTSAISLGTDWARMSHFLAGDFPSANYEI